MQNLLFYVLYMMHALDARHERDKVDVTQEQLPDRCNKYIQKLFVYKNSESSQVLTAIYLRPYISILCNIKEIISASKSLRTPMQKINVSLIFKTVTC